MRVYRQAHSCGNHESSRLDRSRITPWFIFLLAALIRGFVLLPELHYHNIDVVRNESKALRDVLYV